MEAEERAKASESAIAAEIERESGEAAAMVYDLSECIRRISTCTRSHQISPPLDPFRRLSDQGEAR